MINNETYKYFPFLRNSLEGEISSSKIYKEVEIKPEKKKLYDVAVEFESLFIQILLKSMRKTLNKENDLLYGGFQQDIFEDMLYEQYSKIMSKNANFGIAKEIYRQLESFVGEENNIIELQEKIKNQKKYLKELDNLITKEKIQKEWYQ